MKVHTYMFILLLALPIALAATGPSIGLSLINQDPNPVAAGGAMNVRLSVQNTGGIAVNNMLVDIPPTYPFSVVDGPTTQTIPVLDAYQAPDNTVELLYRVAVDPTVAVGEYDLGVRYQMPGGVWVTEQIPIEIATSNYAQVTLDKSSLEPGQETPLDFTITNTGRAAIQNLVFSWSEPNGVILPVYSDDTKYVKYLDVGQSINLSYMAVADVNANPGLYKLNLNLQYDTTGGTGNTSSKTAQTSAGITVGGQTDFDLAFSESSAGQTSLSVANIGNNPALSVSVRVPSQQGYSVSGSPTAIVGNLAKGDYTIVSFQIVTNGGGNSSNFSGAGRNSGATNRTRSFGNYTGNFTGAIGGASGLLVEVDYTDTTGVRQTVEKVVPIQFRAGGAGGTGNFTGRGTAGSSSSSSSILTSPVFIIVVLVVVVGGVWYWRKHRKVTKGR